MACRAYFVLHTISNKSLRAWPSLLHPVSCICQSLNYCSVADNADVIRVQFDQGLPRFLIPLPSRRELCLFTVKPLTHTVQDLCQSIKNEDKGVDRVAMYTKDHTRIALSNSIETLLLQDFTIEINDRAYHVDVPPFSLDMQESLEKINDVKNTIAQLYTNLNVEEYQLRKQRELQAQMEGIMKQLEPLEKKRSELSTKSATHARRLTWMGLSYMGLQFGVLARLTWWEYSWDIMEPVTYFVGYGSAILMFAYYVTTRQEYCFPQVFDRQYLKKFYSEADKSSFDIDRYNELRDSLSQVESDLKRLRDPLLLNLPLQQSNELLEKSYKLTEQPKLKDDFQKAD